MSPHDRRLIWTAAVTFVLAGTSACGSNPNRPDPPADAPRISCPADVAVREVAGISQAVLFSPPSVTGGATPVTTTCTPESGAAFPLGSTGVNCAATDALARHVTCAFTVTLTGFALSVTRFVAVGDSFTAGENGQPGFIDLPNSYPSKLQARFDATYPNQGIVVINRGRNGDPIERTVSELRGILAADKPGAVLVLSGFNDLANGCGNGPVNTPRCQESISDVAFGVRDCIRRSRELPAAIPYVFVSTLTPPGPVLADAVRDRRLAAEVIVQANARIRQMVSAERATLVDPYPLFVGHEAEYVDTDGLHLRPAGYQVLADAFFSAITSLIPQTPLPGLHGLR